MTDPGRRTRRSRHIGLLRRGRGRCRGLRSRRPGKSAASGYLTTDQNVLVLRLLDVQDLLDLERERLARPLRRALVEPAPSKLALAVWTDQPSVRVVSRALAVCLLVGARAARRTDDFWVRERSHRGREIGCLRTHGGGPASSATRIEEHGSNWRVGSRRRTSLRAFSACTESRSTGDVWLRRPRALVGLRLVAKHRSPALSWRRQRRG